MTQSHVETLLIHTLVILTSLICSINFIDSLLSSKNTREPLQLIF